MPHIGCNPDARRHTSQRKNESNLEAPEKVIAIKWAKKKYTGGKQDPKATSGVLPATPPCHLPDIEKADDREEPNHKQFGSDLPMCQAPKSEEDQSQTKNSMFIVLREKVGESKNPAAIFSKSGAVPSHSSQNGVSTPIPEYEKTD